MPFFVSPNQCLRICVDGYNFAMPKGTGVATYGLTLAGMVQRMGHRVEGLFGLDVGKNKETQETVLYDLIGSKRQETRNQARRRIRMEKWQAIFKPRVREIAIKGRVETQSLADRIPSFDRVWSASSLFEAAHWHFRYFGSPMTISMADPPDIMHWTYPLPLRVRGAKNIYTLHDLVPLRMPHVTLDDKQFYHKLIKSCISQGDRICTVSEASRNDILEFFPESEYKVINTYQSSIIPDDIWNSNHKNDADVIRNIFSLPEKGYFLFFGAIDPKKNIDRIIEAYLSSTVKSPLVIVTARDWGMSGENGGFGVNGLYGRIASDRIIKLDYLPRTLLFRLIRTAKAVLMPSLLEGFGLPALEAIQLGTPVIGSSTGSLPEVIGKSGILVDPYSISDIAEAIEKMDTDFELYNRFANETAAQSEKFSEARYKAMLEKLYSFI